MKKILFMAWLFMLSIIPAAAQYHYDYGYDYTVDSDLTLTGRQWHWDGTSILEANDGIYLVIQGPRRYRICFEPYYPDRGLLPYFLNGRLVWYRLLNGISYFLDPYGYWRRMSYTPVYYPHYYYPVARCRHINFYNWHFWHGRPHYRYHGHCYAPPPRHRFYDHRRSLPPQRQIRTPEHRNVTPQRPPARRYESPRREPNRSYRNQVRPAQNRNHAPARNCQRSMHRDRDARPHR